MKIDSYVKFNRVLFLALLSSCAVEAHLNCYQKDNNKDNRAHNSVDHPYTPLWGFLVLWRSKLKSGCIYVVCV